MLCFVRCIISLFNLCLTRWSSLKLKSYRPYCLFALISFANICFLAVTHQMIWNSFLQYNSWTNLNAHVLVQFISQLSSESSSIKTSLYVPEIISNYFIFIPCLILFTPSVSFILFRVLITVYIRPFVCGFFYFVKKNVLGI